MRNSKVKAYLILEKKKKLVIFLTATNYYYINKIFTRNILNIEYKIQGHMYCGIYLNLDKKKTDI